jgi:hypothetical protein
MNIKNGSKNYSKSKYSKEEKSHSPISTNKYNANNAAKLKASNTMYARNKINKPALFLKNNSNLNINQKSNISLNPLKNSKDKDSNHHHSPSNLTFSNKFSNLLNLNPHSPLLNKLEIDINNDQMNNGINSSLSNKEYEENEKKLKETLHLFANNVRRNEGGSVNTLFKIRTVLLNWLKDSEQDNLEYSKFMTEKKIKYLLKNKEKLEARIKNLENDLINIKNRKPELESILGEYISYENEELEQEIERFANSYEIRSGKSTQMIQMFEKKKRVLPFLKEYNSIKEQEISKNKEKIEMEKICKNSLQTLGFLSNYYKNLRKKINDLSSK